jgi:hypothetical protein
MRGSHRLGFLWGAPDALLSGETLALLLRFSIMDTQMGRRSRRGPTHRCFRGEVHVQEKRSIDLAEAKQLVLEDLESFIKDYPVDQNCLREDYLEAPCCWMFFLTPNALKRVAGPVIADLTFVVSKRGELRYFPDLSGDEKFLNDYVSKMSDHFRERGL